VHIDANPSSAGFRHITRSLNAGEAIPRVPSLFEQLTACTRGPVVVDEPEAEAAIEETEDEE
jgi:hypothetical protein